MPAARASRRRRLGRFDRIPRGGHGEGHGKDGAIAVDDVEPEEDGDVEARFVDGDVLEAVDLLGVGNPEDGTGAVFSESIFAAMPIWS